VLKKLQVKADAAGHIEWEVSVDSTVCRAHQHAAGARKKGLMIRAAAGCRYCLTFGLFGIPIFGRICFGHEGLRCQRILDASSGFRRAVEPPLGQRRRPRPPGGHDAA